jgi:hypothetical protein
VRSRWRCVLDSGCVGIRGEYFPIDQDDVVIACSQINWKENSLWLQSLCTCFVFPCGLTVWLVLKLWVLKMCLQWILRLLNSVDHVVW